VASLAITPCEQRDKFQTKNELSLFLAMGSHMTPQAEISMQPV
jgi:hypothetical protein